jgi:hypothetical protein
MGIFVSPCPFRHGDSPYGYGDLCFCLPLSHGCTGAPLKFWPRNQNFPTCNGNSQIPISKRGLPVSIRGFKWHQSPFRYGDYQGLPYGNGDSQMTPFPYWNWKNIDSHFDTGITRDYHIETGTVTSPDGNGTWPLPYGDQKQTNPRINTGITAP